MLFITLLIISSVIEPFAADSSDLAEGLTKTSPVQSSSSSPSTSSSPSSSAESSDSLNSQDPLETNAVKMYRRFFKQKRAAHLEAIKKMLQVGAYEKQFKMLKLVLTKLFMVVSDARVKLMEAGFTPGDPFPKEEHVQDVLSIVLENTAFLGEIVLRLPDVAHSLLRNNSEWQSTVQWCVSFSNDTKILAGNEQELLNLMAQELGLIERSPDFINPYREDAKLEKMVDEEAEKLLKEKMKEAKKKERSEKKKKRGPRLSTARHNEL